jgi:methylated-DNA-[protein]-cysteine S-methyltransferase
MFNALSLASPVGTLSVFEKQGEIIAVEWGDRIEGEASDVLIEAQNQLNAYFSGKLKSFALPLNISGSDFQRSVCQLMLEIPYSETWTYGDIAKKLNSSAQPVGGACGRNSIPIIIPCHRVVGAKGKMTGFSGSGGVKTKKALLRHEGWMPSKPDLFA